MTDKQVSFFCICYLYLLRGKATVATRLFSGETTGVSEITEYSKTEYYRKFQYCFINTNANKHITGITGSRIYTHGRNKTKRGEKTSED